ncbi:MAG: sugar phosphate isomerase/epimerase [Paenibacillus sp.]|jgi:hypothetical protein|nr:sugar phosphate isomerase/epimerase [Paenibacillus sp.]
MYIARWGMNEPLPELFAKAADAGYAGIECGAPSESEEAPFSSLLKQRQFDYIAQIYSAGDDPIADFRHNADASSYGTTDRRPMERKVVDETAFRAGVRRR